MTKRSPIWYFKISPRIIRPAVMHVLRFPLSLRIVEDLLHEPGVDVSHETVRFWWHRFGPMFAAKIKKRRIEGMKSSRWRWHLDEVFAKINGERHYLSKPSTVCVPAHGAVPCATMKKGPIRAARDPMPTGPDRRCRNPIRPVPAQGGRVRQAPNRCHLGAVASPLKSCGCTGCDAAPAVCAVTSQCRRPAG